ncbi:MAG: hypothetical protein ACREBC_31360, partial [Pyrinomonadaceae bacterium]
VVLDTGMLVPIKYTGGTITLDAAHGTLPRVDQVIAKISGYEVVSIEKLTGTATTGAQINRLGSANYRAGALALPNDAIRLCDIHVPALDTVIDAGQIVDRRPHCTTGKLAIPTSQTLTSTTFDTQDTPDLISNVVLPQDGVIAVLFSALLESSVADAAEAAIFLNSNQQKAWETANRVAVTIAAPSNTTAGIAVGVTTSAHGLFTHTLTTSDMGPSVTTGQSVSVLSDSGTRISINGAHVSGYPIGIQGGPCYIFAAAGTYEVSIRYKASSGTAIALERKLWAWAEF